MPIARPTTKTIISTSQWGVPITDGVNANTTDVANLKTATAVSAWTNVPYTNGWSDFGSGYSGGQYRKVGDIVYVRGLIKGGTIPSAAFTLPVGFRPPLSVQFPSQAGGAFAWFEVLSNGACVPNSGAASAFNINCSFSTV